MLEFCSCPICRKKGEISIKSKFSDRERNKVVFYAKCNECGYESFYYNTSNEVIEYLYDRMKYMGV